MSITILIKSMDSVSCANSDLTPKVNFIELIKDVRRYFTMKMGLKKVAH